MVVNDSAGRTIYTYEVINKDGNLHKDTKICNTVLGDESGKPTIKVWETEKILYDNRIPPRGFVIEVFEFPVSGATFPMNVQIRLLYRSAPQDLINKLMKEKPVVPVVEMVKISAKI